MKFSHKFSFSHLNRCPTKTEASMKGSSGRVGDQPKEEKISPPESFRYVKFTDKCADVVCTDIFSYLL